MNNEAKKRVQDLFEGMEENTLSATDPEWVDIVANFSQNETVKESSVSSQRCWDARVWASIRICSMPH